MNDQNLSFVAKFSQKEGFFSDANFVKRFLQKENFRTAQNVGGGAIVPCPRPPLCHNATVCQYAHTGWSKKTGPLYILPNI